jgi:hypothetical protein
LENDGVDRIRVGFSVSLSINTLETRRKKSETVPDTFWVAIEFGREASRESRREGRLGLAPSVRSFGVLEKADAALTSFFSQPCTPVQG